MTFIESQLTTKKRPLVMSLKPLWLREKFFYKLYANDLDAYSYLSEKASLEFAPQISLNLMATDISHCSIAFCGFYELKVSRTIAKLAKTGGLMIDVGANYGYYSSIWAAANPQNRVIAFEASPRNLSPLKQNLIDNRLEKQVDVREQALGKESGKLLFNLGPQEQSGWGGLVVDGKKTNSIEVPVVSLDEIFLSGDREHIIDVLKIDTEGADTWILQGAEQLLRQKKINHVFFEENLIRMAALGIQPAEAQNLLKDCGYKLTKLSENEWYANLD